MTQGRRSGLRTSTLLRRLFRAPDLDTFIERNANDMAMPQLHAYISALCGASGQVRERIIKRAGIDRTYGHQIFNGTRKPSRDKVIQLAFGFGLDVDGTQELLKVAQRSPLYPRIKRDAAILYCLNHHKDMLETQSVLQALGQPLLGGEDRHG
jgi:transcriptional regulator with XRE-family HTH domain